MTTEDENHQSIIRTSPRRFAKGMAILVVVMAVGCSYCRAKLDQHGKVSTSCYYNSD